MLLSSIPAKFTIPWASSAGAAYLRAIPTPSQIGITTGAASLTDGFPPWTAEAGGAPDMRDFQGILKWITQWAQWDAAGGAIQYDPAFQAAIGGYPKSCMIASAVTSGLFWFSTSDNNATNPDAGGGGWVAFNPITGYLPLTGGVISGNLSVGTTSTVREFSIASEMAIIPSATTAFINVCDSIGNNGPFIDLVIRGLTGSAASLCHSIQLQASNINTFGPVTVPSDPTIPMHLATKQYVDNKTASVTSYSNAYYSGSVALSLGSLTQLSGLTYTSTTDVTFTGSSATINTPGTYLISSQATINIVYSGASIVSASYQIERNGGVIATAIFNTYFPGSASSYPILEPSRVISCAAGDVITLWANATATLGTSASWSTVSLDIARIK